MLFSIPPADIVAAPLVDPVRPPLPLSTRAGIKNSLFFVILMNISIKNGQISILPYAYMLLKITLNFL